MYFQEKNIVLYSGQYGNSDGLPVIFMVYQKVYILNRDWWYILPIFTILSKQKYK